MNSLLFRMATEADAFAISGIYAPYVETTAVTFETEVPGVAEFARRIHGTLRRYPYLVCEDNGMVIGYAYAFEQMERTAYRWNAGLSVYLDHTRTGKGAGTALYSALIAILKLQNIQNVYGGITRPNPASEALHKKLGFTKLGVYHKTGFKLEEWHDVVWYEKHIGDLGIPPLPPLALTGVSDEAVTKILRNAGASAQVSDRNGWTKGESSPL